MISESNLLSVNGQDGLPRPAEGIIAAAANAALESEPPIKNRPSDEDEHESAQKEKRRKRKLNMFVGCACLTGLLMKANQIVRYGVLTELEREFQFSAIILGLIVASYEVGHVLSLSLLYVLNKHVHKPCVCLAGGLFGIMSCAVWVAPYFVKEEDTSSLASCHPQPTENNAPCPSSSQNLTDLVNTPSSQITTTAAILMTSQVLLGAGAAPFISTAVNYIEQNSSAAFTAAAASVLVMVTSSGSIIGFFLAAAVSIPASLSSITSTIPHGVTWCLGPVSLSLPLLVVSLMFLIFPRQMEAPPQTEVIVCLSRRSSYCSNVSQEDLRASYLRLDLRNDASVVTFASSASRDVKDVSKSEDKGSKSLSTNLVFLCELLASCCIQYLSAGLCPFLVKYLQTQFMVTSVESNVIAAVCFGIGSVLGTCSGGYATSSLELKPTTLARFVLLSLFLAIVCFTSAIFIGCPDLETARIVTLPKEKDVGLTWMQVPECPFRESLDVQCLSQCLQNASNVKVHAACCSDIHAMPPPGEGVSVSNVTAVTSWCHPVCANLMPYIIILFLVIFFTTVANPPLMGIVVRCANDKRRSVALAVQTLSGSLLAIIPAPILYGIIVDKSRIRIEEAGNNQKYSNTEGLYENSSMRLWFHGLMGTLLLLAVFLISAIYLKLKRMEFASLAKNRREPECPIEIRLEDMSLLDPSCTITQSQSILTLNTQQ